MYRALAFKELRETAFIGGLMVFAMALVVLDTIGGSVSPWRLSPFGAVPDGPFTAHKIPFIHAGFANSLAIVAVTGGLALGFLQVLGESFRATWLYLLHRPAPRGGVMLTKIAAGVALLLAATIGPLVALALWAATPGTHASPFDWRMTAEPLRVCFAATAIYLAAFLAGLREARWFGSRLLPLVPAAIVVLWIFEVPIWFAAGWILIAICDVLYLVAILYVAQSREYP